MTAKRALDSKEFLGNICITMTWMHMYSSEMRLQQHRESAAIFILATDLV